MIISGVFGWYRAAGRGWDCWLDGSDLTILAAFCVGEDAQFGIFFWKKTDRSNWKPWPSQHAHFTYFFVFHCKNMLRGEVGSRRFWVKNAPLLRWVFGLLGTGSRWPWGWVISTIINFSRMKKFIQSQWKFMKQIMKTNHEKTTWEETCIVFLVCWGLLPFLKGMTHNWNVRKPAAFLGFLREAWSDACFSFYTSSAWINVHTLYLLLEVYTLEKYHKSMVDGLMVYGMMRAIKKWYCSRIFLLCDFMLDFRNFQIGSTNIQINLNKKNLI